MNPPADTPRRPDLRNGAPPGGRRRIMREGFLYTLLTLIGKISGFLREWLMAYFFGASLITDAYRVAIDLVRSIVQIFSGTTVETSLVPLLTRWRTRNTPRLRALLLRFTAWTSLGISLVFALGFAGFAPWITRIQVPTYDAESAAMVTTMIRWIGPAVPLFVACNLAGYLLISYHRLGAFGLMPLVLNLGQIAGTILVGKNILPPEVLPVSYDIALVVAFAILLFDAWRRRPSGGRFTKERMRLVAIPLLRNIWPLLLLAFIGQGRIFIDKIIASTLAVGAIAALWYARFIIEFPLTTAGNALLRLALPHFSEVVEKKDTAKLRRQYLILLDTSLWLLVPVVVLVLRTANDLIRLIYAYGAFDADSVEMTTLALMGASPALVTLIIQPLTVRIINAQGRNVRLLDVMTVQAVLNVALAYGLSRYWGVAGIALAMGVAQLLATMALIPRLQIGVTRAALGRILLWGALGGVLYLFLWMVHPGGSPLVTLLLNLVLTVSGWLALSLLVPQGRAHLARFRRMNGRGGGKDE
ncbi:MAG TPA: hypothetical protein ENI92_08210 [Bacteroidetes bacterium]|nr:hypothetical protein [Bacteroidota bacterium]